MASVNFKFLTGYDRRLAEYAGRAESHLHTDPEAALVYLRRFGELVVKLVSEYINHDIGGDRHLDLIKKLRLKDTIPEDVARKLRKIRRLGSYAAHVETPPEEEKYPDTLAIMQDAYDVGVWFNARFQERLGKERKIQPQAFQEPKGELTKEHEKELMQKIRYRDRELVRLRTKLKAAEARGDALEVWARNVEAAASLREVNPGEPAQTTYLIFSKSITARYPLLYYNA